MQRVWIGLILLLFVATSSLHGEVYAQDKAPDGVPTDLPDKNVTKKRDPASESRKPETGRPGQRQLSFAWEPVEAATGYEVELKNKSFKDSKVRVEKVSSAEVSVWVDPGVYDIRLRSKDARGVPGEWDEPFEVVVKIVSPQLIKPKQDDRYLSKDDETQDIRFKWKEVPGAKEYQLEVRDVATGENVFVEKTSKTSVRKELSVAKKYEWRVTSILRNGDFGEPGVFGNVFSVYGERLEQPEIEEITTKFVREIKWEGPERAEGYSYAIYKKDKSGAWKKMEQQKLVKDTTIPFDMKFPGGRYKFRVLSRADLWQPSKSSEVEFDVWDGDRSPAAVWRHEMRESLEKPTNAYFVASYLLTAVDFYSTSREISSAASASAVGGTGRLGAGYFFPDSSWGLLGIADLSGVIIDDENYTYAAAEAHVSWRTYWDVTQLRISGGLYYKELPTQVVDNATTAEVTIENSSGLGPHAGFDFWYPFSHKLGIQLNARGYLAVTGTAANGQDIEPSLSYQVGFMGSYNLAKNLVGFAGYAYRVDSLEFGLDSSKDLSSSSTTTSTGSSSTLNEVSIEGHYINLLLEYGF